MIGYLYNNIGISSLSIISVLNHKKNMEISKSLLILPLVSNLELLAYLSRKNIKIQTIEQLIVKKTKCFSNFNERFYDSLVVTINAIQFLVDVDIVGFTSGKIHLKKDIEYHKTMGKRSMRIFKASKTIAGILDAPKEDLYTNLRVQV